MAIRAGMQPLVDRVRRTIGDTAEPHVFEDDDLQAGLDGRRVSIGGVVLEALPVVTGDPTEFSSPFGFWESAALQLSDGAALTPDLADLMAGTWTFTAGQGGPVYVAGRAFDFWGAAADLCEQWAARVSLEFDFGTDQQTFNRSDKRKGLLAVAREYGRRALPVR